MEKKRYKELGQRLTAARLQKGLKQKDVAKIIGVHDNLISYYENGERRPNVDQYVQMAELFDVSVEYLLGLSDIPTSDKNLQFVCDYTGLSKSAVLILNHNKRERAHYLNTFVDGFIHLCNENEGLIVNHGVLSDSLWEANDYINNQPNKQSDVSIQFKESLSEDFLYFQVLQYKLSLAFNKYLNDSETEKILNNLGRYLDYCSISNDDTQSE